MTLWLRCADTDSQMQVKVALLNERINLDSGKESKTDADGKCALNGADKSEPHLFTVIISWHTIAAEKDLERFRKAVSLTFDVLAARSKSDVVTTTVLRNLLHTVRKLSTLVLWRQSYPIPLLYFTLSP